MGFDTTVVPLVQQGAEVSAALLGTSGSLILHNVGNWIMNLATRRALEGSPNDRGLIPYVGKGIATRTKQRTGGTKTMTKTKTKFMKLRHVCRDRRGHRIPCSKKKMNQY